MSDIPEIAPALFRAPISLINDLGDGSVHDLGPKAALLLAGFGLIWVLSVGIYRLFWSPISNIPGPRLAALTFWYEGFYEVWLGGQFFRKLEELHKQYGEKSSALPMAVEFATQAMRSIVSMLSPDSGPVVRINPIEVHYNDPEFIDSVLAGPSKKTNRHPSLAKKTGTPASMVTTVDHDTHRHRRAAVSGFFSTASIRQLEPILTSKMANLMGRLEQSAETGSAPLALHHVFKACTSDVINQYAFGDCLGFMDREDFGKPYFDATDLFFGLNHVMIFFPWFAMLIQNTPNWFVKAVMPSLAELVDKKSWWIDKVREIRASPNPERVKSTIFEGILNSNLPSSDKTDLRLASEAQLVIFAGEGTTAFTLQAAVYELLANPPVLARLREELAAAIPDADAAPTFAQVDGLPFFNAVVQEVVRLHPGVMNRQMRVPASDPVVYLDDKRPGASGRELVVPAGFLVSVSPLAMHMNPEIFEDPYEFRPHRWIDNPKLARSFLGFSRGTRSCLGMNLARREIAVVLATIFRKYDVYRGQKGRTLELYNTERARDIDANHDMIIPSPAKGSKGLQVRVRN